MDKKEATGSPGWGASLFLQTTEDVATDEGGSPLQRLQRQVNKVLQGFSSPPQLKTPGTYNPELLTTQKRQWANFQLHYLVSLFILLNFDCLSLFIYWNFFVCKILGPSISEAAK